MKDNRIKDALETIARRGVPENTNLWPRIESRLDKRSSFMQTLRARPVMAIVLVLLALAFLTTVAYAIGRLTGYIPGIGMIDQSAPLRVLAEPVRVTRAGIILTVEQVVLSADKTVLTYKVEGIPADSYSSDEVIDGVSSYSYSRVVVSEGTPDITQSSVEDDNHCFADNSLLLPGDLVVVPHSGEGSGWISGFESRIVYDPIPVNVNSATFHVSCVEGTVPGKLPENWEVLLWFVPAPSDMTILPVVDVIAPVPAADESLPAMTLEKVIDTDDGYILIGKFRSIGLPAHAMAQGEPIFVKITDANRQIVDASLASNLESNNVFGEFGWGYEITGKQHAWPLTLSIDSVHVLFYQQKTEFEFDTGSKPREEQKWILNQDIQFEGYTIRVVSIERTHNGYAFIFKADPDVTGITAEIKDFPSSSGYGGNDGFGKGDLYSGNEYKGEPPFGKLTIELGWLTANIHGPWQVQWSPENISPTP